MRTTTAELSRAGLLPAGDAVVAGIVAKLAVVYGQSMTPDQLKLLTVIWVEELADYPADLLDAAYHHVARTHTGGWFPKPAQMIEAVQQRRADRIVDLREAQRTKALPPPPPTDAERAIAADALARIKANLATPAKQQRSEAQRATDGMTEDEAAEHWRKAMGE